MILTKFGFPEKNIELLFFFPNDILLYTIKQDRTIYIFNSYAVCYMDIYLLIQREKLPYKCVKFI